jgi:thiol-disulfide isomerase/thioredoxin
VNLRQFLTLALAGVLLGAAVGGIYNWLQHRPETHGPASLGSLPEFTLPNIDGTQWRAEEWRGKILVVNFWASWCPPCRKEMPLFVRLQEELGPSGVLFVGVAIDDPRAVRDFIDTHGIEFPILLGQEKGIELARRLGNRMEALPYTVVADRNGRLVLRQAGELTEESLRPLLEKLLSRS